MFCKCKFSNLITLNVILSIKIRLCIAPGPTPPACRSQAAPGRHYVMYVLTIYIIQWDQCTLALITVMLSRNAFINKINHNNQDWDNRQRLVHSYQNLYIEIKDIYV